ncbi:MAG: sigma-70 family RNA polymerase sigma factor [Waterburya sp.]
MNEIKKKRSHLLPKKQKIPCWYWFYQDTMYLNKISIEIYIKKLNLLGVSNFEDVQGNIYIILYNLDRLGKLIFQSKEEIFIYVKKDGTKNEILNFKAWCRTTSFNYLKQLRRERNKVDVISDIDDDYFRNKVSTDTIIYHLEYEEVKEKIKSLKELDKRIIEMCFFEGYKFGEISEKLEEEGFGSIKTYTLRQRKLRAIKKLRKLFLPSSN